jgi:hypothetical protein
MDKKTVFIKTAKAERDGSNLSSDLKRILSLIDDKSKADELTKRAPPSLRDGCMEFLGELEDGGYIRDKNKSSVEPKIAKPKSSLLKMFTPKPATEQPMEELDYHSSYKVSAPNEAELAAKKKADEAARIRAEMEAAVEVAKNRATAEATAKAEAKARLEAENAARAKALAEADAAIKAEYKAKKEAESAARAKASAEAKAKQESAQRLLIEAAEAKARQEAKIKLEAKAKLEAAARLKEQEEAARAKAALEAAVRVRAEIEAAARAQQIAEAKVKQEMAARMKAEQEAALAKAALEAAAKAKIAEELRVRAEIEAAARARQLAEANARREAEAARLKAEQEAMQIKAELEAAKARAEAEAKALAEVLARQAAEEKARQEAEAARLKARQEAEAARIRAEQEAVAKLRAEAEIKAATEALARQQLAEEAARREVEEQIRRADLNAWARDAQESSASASAASSFEINLDSFAGGTDPVAKSLVPAGQYVTQPDDQVKTGAKADQEQRAAAVAKAEAEKNSMNNVAAEMARLKNEAEAARRKLEEEARRQAEEQVLAEEQSRAWEEAAQRAKVQAIIEVEQATQQAALTQAKATQTPVTRKQRRPLPIGKIAFTLFVLSLITVLLLPYIYPLEDYISPLEQRLSARLNQPVHIGSLSASSLPPMLQLQNVTVGNAQEVKIGSVILNFDPLSLLSEPRVISNAEFHDVSIQGRLLDKQVASLKLLGGDTQYPVRHLTIQRVKIVTDEIALPIMSGIADLDAPGTFNRVALHSNDEKLGFDLQNIQGRWQLSINLRESSLPIFPEIVFSDFNAKGDMVDGEVNFTEMNAHIYNGIMFGKAKLAWSKGWKLQGSLEAKTFDLDKMFPKYHLEGEVFGEGTFSMTGAKLSQMDDVPHLDGSFSVKKGTISVDMVETARLSSRENLVGGRTHFDDLIGLVQLDNNSVHFRQVRIASEKMSSNGSFDVSTNGQISGNFNAEIKSHAGNNQLTLYGTLVEPKLRAGH